MDNIFKQIEILLVEDNMGDAELTIEALKESKINNNLHHVKDGSEALKFLNNEAGYENKPKPDLILLDLSNGINTFNVLNENHPEIPIVVLSGLEDEELARQTIKGGAQDYLSKSALDKNTLERCITYSLERFALAEKFRTELNNKIISEERISHLNNVLEAIRNINKLIIVEKDKQSLLTNACRQLVNSKRVNKAAISIFNPLLSVIVNSDESGNILNVSHNSILPCHAKYMEQNKIMIVHESDYCISCQIKCTHISGSVLITPLLYQGIKYGSISITLENSEISDDQERIIITELAADIAFALNKIDTEIEKEAAETNLIESEKRFRSIFENAVMGFYRCSMNGEIIMANYAMIKMFGYSDFYEFANNFRLNTISLKIRKAGEVIEDLESELYTKNGEKIFVSESGRIIYDKNGIPEFYEGTIENITARKHAEDKLHEQAVQYHNLANSGVALVWTSGLDKLCNYFNKPWLDFTGRTLEQEYGYGWAEGVHPDDLNYCVEIYNNAFDKQAPFEMEYRLKHNTGEYRWITDLGQPNYDYKGKFAGYIGHCFDITDEKKSKLELQESERKFREVVENAAEIIITTNRQGYFNYVNQAGIKLSGYSFEEIAQMYFTDMISPEYKNKIKKKYLRQIVNRIENSYEEFPVQNKKGEIIWIGQNARLMMDNNGVKGFFLISRDVTSRKIAEDKLTSSEEKYRLLFETMVQGVIFQDSDNTIISANPAAQKILGFSLNQLQGKKTYEKLWMSIREDATVFPADEQPSIVALNTGKPVNNKIMGVYNPVKKDYVWININATPLFENGDTAPSKVYTTFEDVTELKKTEKELIKAKENAEEMNRVKSIFFANMSHELRTPLIGILGYTELLLIEPLGDEYIEMIEIVHKSGKRLLETLNLVLNLSKIESEEFDLLLDTVDVEQVLSDTYNLFLKIIDNKEIQFNKINKTPGLKILSDIRIIENILNNLINNSIKFTAKGSITLISEEVKINEKRYLRFTVCDTGIGISKENQKIIFDEFRQVSEGYSRRFEGTGLGLTISKKFVKKLEGEIYVESEPGTGSRFYFDIPLVQPEVKVIPEIIITENGTTAEATGTILVVDDEQFAREIVPRMVYPKYKIETAGDGLAAIRMMQEKTYELVLLDIGLKNNLDGIEILKMVREIPGYKPVPVIAFTAYALKEDLENIMSAGFDDYLTKPFTKAELLNTINRNLEKQEVNSY